MKKFILTMMACVAMLSANAQLEVSIKNVNYEKDTPGSFDICFKTPTEAYSAYQAFVYLPEGLKLDTKKTKVLADGDAVADNDMSYTWTPNAAAAPDMTGYQKFFLAAYDTDNAPMATTEGASVVTINYLASDIEKLSVVLKNVKLAVPSGDPTKTLVVDEVRTAINSIKADQKAASNVVYGLNGARKGQMTQGVNIVNGQKVIK